MPPPAPDRIAFFARTNFRNERRTFGINRADRRAHMYVIGKTGTGKSTLLETLISQDITHGEGVALIDPHGDFAERVLHNIPRERKGDVLYFDPVAPDPLSFNPLEHLPPARRPLAAAGLLDAFKKIWADSWGPRLEHILRNALLALLDQSDATLGDVLRMLADSSFRRHVASRVQNPHVRSFWLEEYEGYPARFRAEAIAPIQNKVGAFVSNPILHRVVGRPSGSFDVRQIMDEGKILIVNLAKGKIGEDAAALLGAMLVSKLSLAALSRADVPEDARRDFYLYLDEFQNFTTLSFASMLSELRKYRVNLILAHQYLVQLDTLIKSAVLGNAGTIICFRLGMEDAEILAKEFYPVFAPVDLVSLPNHQIYLRLMVDGMASRPFSADTVKL
ncbi:MAG: type IV secretion system DNA-binding domain-containing protein [Terracidiphilus sp.]|jgi:energy-coupling factor transporter ATP-binding protein EcfA2